MPHHAFLNTTDSIVQSVSCFKMDLQAANDKQAAAQSKTLKRPTFKRPAKRPTPSAPIGDEVAQPSNKRPRLDVLLQQNTAQSQNASDGVRSSAAPRDLAGDPQVWSPTQHTAAPPYSPGVFTYCHGAETACLLAYVPDCHAMLFCNCCIGLHVLVWHRDARTPNDKQTNDQQTITMSFYAYDARYYLASSVTCHRSCESLRNTWLAHAMHKTTVSKSNLSSV